MRFDNLAVSVLGGVAVILAVLISWRGRDRATVIPSPPSSQPWRDALEDAIRSLAVVLAAAVVAGVLVAGLGGRLVMRVLAVTSGDVAQGARTEADEIVGDITVSGTIAFVLFVGLVFPVAAAFPYLALRRVLPARAWMAGIVFGLLLLATFGVGDPLSADNIDFLILEPVALAVGLIVVLGLLYGTTYAAFAARLDVTARRVSAAGWRGKLPYLSLIVLIFPAFAMIAVAYVVGRGLARGRIGEFLERRPLPAVAHALVLGLTVAAVVVVAIAAADII